MSQKPEEYKYVISVVEDIFKYPWNWESYQEVVLVSNDDYEYLIPKELEAEFESMTAQIDDAYESDDVLEDDEISNNVFVHQLQSDFNDKFDQYRKEGTLPKLYAKVGYEKEL